MSKKIFFFLLMILPLPSLNLDPEMPLIPPELLGIEVPALPPVRPIASVAMPELMAARFFGRISSGYGWRSSGMHYGMDIPLPMGTPITAVRGGVVRRAEFNAGGYGRLVVLDHGGGLETRYAHCSMLAVSVGDRVSAGQTIAYAGSSGRSTASHLHFEVLINGIAHNPAQFLFGGF